MNWRDIERELNHLHSHFTGTPDEINRINELDEMLDEMRMQTC